MLHIRPLFACFSKDGCYAFASTPLIWSRVIWHYSRLSSLSATHNWHHDSPARFWCKKFLKPPSSSESLWRACQALCFAFPCIAVVIIFMSPYLDRKFLKDRERNHFKIPVFAVSCIPHCSVNIHCWRWCWLIYIITLLMIRDWWRLQNNTKACASYSCIFQVFLNLTFIMADTIGKNVF